MPSALRELVALFEIGVDDHELEEANKKLEGFVGRVRKVGEVVAEAFAIKVLGEFAMSAIEAGAQVADLSVRLGIGTDELQKFEFAAGLVGVGAEQASHALGLLNRSVGEAITGGKEQAQTFAKLHVTLKDAAGAARPVGDVLGDVADAIKELPDPQTRAAYAMKLFGREGQTLLPILVKGREGLAEMGAEFDELGGGMSQEFVAASKKADDALKKLHLALVGLKSRIVGEALPGILKFIDGLKGIVVHVLDFIKHTNVLQHAMVALGVMGAGKLIVTLGSLAKSFGLLKPSVLETLGALLKFALPIALFAILALAIDDVWTGLQGGQSVIGDMLEQFGGVEEKKKFFAEMSVTVRDLTEAFKSLGPMGADAFKGMLEALPALVTGLGAMVIGVVKLFGALKGVVDVLAVTAAAFTTGDWNHVGTTIDKVGNDFFGDAMKPSSGISNYGVDPKNIRGSGTSTTDAAQPANLGWTPVPPGQAVSLPLGGGGAAGAASASGGHTVTQHTEVNVTVASGANAAETGRAVGNGAASEVDKANARALAAVVQP